MPTFGTLKFLLQSAKNITTLCRLRDVESSKISPLGRYQARYSYRGWLIMEIIHSSRLLIYLCNLWVTSREMSHSSQFFPHKFHLPSFSHRHTVLDIFFMDHFISVWNCSWCMGAREPLYQFIILASKTLYRISLFTFNSMRPSFYLPDSRYLLYSAI